jgi:hypothetical protein
MNRHRSRQHIIVGVHEDYDRAPAHGKARIGGGDDSTIRLEANAEPPAVGLDDPARIVGRAVIYNDHFQGLVVLREDTFDALL